MSSSRDLTEGELLRDLIRCEVFGVSDYNYRKTYEGRSFKDGLYRCFKIRVVYMNKDLKNTKCIKLIYNILVYSLLSLFFVSRKKGRRIR